MTKIQYPDKVKGDLFFGTEATEVKNSANALYSDKKTWYLSSDGDDSNIGSTAAEPFENPQIALDAAASGDVIEILDIGYSKSGAFAFSKDVTIIGPAGYNSTNAANISGQFTITGGANLQFQNMHLGGVSIISIVGDADISVYNSRLLLTTVTANVIDLRLSICEFDTSNEIDLKSLEMRASDGGTFKINTEGVLTMYNSHYEGEMEVGTGGSSNCIMRNSNIGGALTVTGNLDTENSRVKGILTVSATTTGVPKQLETIKIPIGARDTDHTTGTNKVGLHIDYNFTFIGLPTLEFDPIITDGGPTGTSFVVDINVTDIDGANEATILSTKLSVDAGEFHSSTAATPAVLSSNTIAQYKFISIDIDQKGGTIAGKGGFVTLNGFRN